MMRSEEAMMMAEIYSAVILASCACVGANLYAGKAKGRDSAIWTATAVMVLAAICGWVFSALAKATGSTYAELELLTFAAPPWIMWAAWRNLSRRGEGKARSLAAVAIATLFVLSLTVFFREPGDNGKIRPSLTAFLSEEGYLEHFFLNTILFVPFGAAMGAAFRRKTDFFAVTAAGTAFSACVESLQMIAKMGESDVADLVANSFGSAVGFLAMYVLLRAARNAKR